MQLVACIKKTGDETKHRVVNGGIRSAPTENGNDPTDYSCRIRLNAHHPRSEIDNIDRYLVRSIGYSVYINESSLLRSGCIISSWFLVLCWGKKKAHGWSGMSNTGSVDRVNVCAPFSRAFLTFLPACISFVKIPGQRRRTKNRLYARLLTRAANLHPDPPATHSGRTEARVCQVARF